ncbi:MAG: redoxin domain-containing protein [Nanoarchaeota archaeon]|nr:redoxin domain-containing protein [Nanoarchaeota archaeon]
MGVLDFLTRKLQRVDTLSNEKLELFPKEWVNTKPFTIDDMKGNVLLVEFTSLEETKETIHQMNLWNQMFPKESFQLLSIYSPENRKTEIAKLKMFLHNSDVKYPVMIDDRFKTSDMFKANLRPSFYLFDKKRRIRFCIMSAKDLDRVGAAIMKLISER